MQNEITELRNQVRTLKRIVYGFGCLLVAGVVVSATSVQNIPSVITVNHNLEVSQSSMSLQDSLRMGSTNPVNQVIPFRILQ